MELISSDPALLIFGCQGCGSHDASDGLKQTCDVLLHFAYGTRGHPVRCAAPDISIDSGNHCSDAVLVQDPGQMQQSPCPLHGVVHSLATALPTVVKEAEASDEPRCDPVPTPLLVGGLEAEGVDGWSGGAGMDDGAIARDLIQRVSSLLRSTPSSSLGGDASPHDEAYFWKVRVHRLRHCASELRRSDVVLGCLPRLRAARSPLAAALEDLTGVLPDRVETATRAARALHLACTSESWRSLLDVPSTPAASPSPPHAAQLGVAMSTLCRVARHGGAHYSRTLPGSELHSLLRRLSSALVARCAAYVDDVRDALHRPLVHADTCSARLARCLAACRAWQAQAHRRGWKGHHPALAPVALFSQTVGNVQAARTVSQQLAALAVRVAAVATGPGQARIIRTIKGLANEGEALARRTARGLDRASHAAVRVAPSNEGRGSTTPGSTPYQDAAGGLASLERRVQRALHAVLATAAHHHERLDLIAVFAQDLVGGSLRQAILQEAAEWATSVRRGLECHAPCGADPGQGHDAVRLLTALGAALTACAETERIAADTQRHRALIPDHARVTSACDTALASQRLRVRGIARGLADLLPVPADVDAALAVPLLVETVRTGSDLGAGNAQPSLTIPDLTPRFPPALLDAFALAQTLVTRAPDPPAGAAALATHAQAVLRTLRCMGALVLRLSYTSRQLRDLGPLAARHASGLRHALAPACGGQLSWASSHAAIQITVEDCLRRCAAVQTLAEALRAERDCAAHVCASIAAADIQDSPALLRTADAQLLGQAPSTRQSVARGLPSAQLLAMQEALRAVHDALGGVRGADLDQDTASAWAAHVGVRLRAIRTALAAAAVRSAEAAGHRPK